MRVYGYAVTDQKKFRPILWNLTLYKTDTTWR